MTTAEQEVLLALNLRQMQGEETILVQEIGVPTADVARAAGRTNKSAAVLLSHMRDAPRVGDLVPW